MAFGRFAAKPLARTLDCLARPWRSALTLYRVVVRPGGAAQRPGRLVVFYFRFRNPASSPRVFPKVKEYLPRLLGAAALILVARANLDRVLAAQRRAGRDRSGQHLDLPAARQDRRGIVVVEI
jgi:hypothetical protein